MLSSDDSDSDSEVSKSSDASEDEDDSDSKASSKSASRSSSQSKSKSRSRSRSPRKDRSRGSRFQTRKRKSGPTKSSGDRDGAKKPKKESGKSKGTLPEIVTNAWSNFLTPAAIMLVSSLGIVTSFLPSLESLPLGGRIRHFVDNWRKITDNQWVLSVVEKGYQIPLRSLPNQSKIPKNPPAKGSAHEVLVKEADDLLRKHAVSIVAPVDGQYISAYFAVPKPRK